MNPVICTGSGSRCVERERNGGVRIRRIGIRVSRGIFDKFEEGIWWRRRRVSESSRIEEVGARREDDGRICVRV